MSGYLTNESSCYFSATEFSTQASACFNRISNMNFALLILDISQIIKMASNTALPSTILLHPIFYNYKQMHVTITHEQNNYSAQSTRFASKGNGITVGDRTKAHLPEPQQPNLQVER
jgi:hypothetical protein